MVWGKSSKTSKFRSLSDGASVGHAGQTSPIPGSPTSPHNFQDLKNLLLTPFRSLAETGAWTSQCWHNIRQVLFIVAGNKCVMVHVNLIDFWICSHFSLFSLHSTRDYITVANCFTSIQISFLWHIPVLHYKSQSRLRVVEVNQVTDCFCVFLHSSNNACH